VPDRPEQDLTDLYESEIKDSVRSVSEIADWLGRNAVRCYPNSDFAKEYSRGFF
jgi:hypothetical protein